MSPYMPAMPAVGGLDHSQGKWFAPGEALPPGYVITTHPEGHTAPQEGHAMSEMASASFVIPASSAAAAVKTGSAVKSKKSKKKKSSGCCWGCWGLQAHPFLCDFAVRPCEYVSLMTCRFAKQPVSSEEFRWSGQLGRLNCAAKTCENLSRVLGEGFAFCNVFPVIMMTMEKSAVYIYIVQMLFCPSWRLLLPLLEGHRYREWVCARWKKVHNSWGGRTNMGIDSISNFSFTLSQSVRDSQRQVVMKTFACLPQSFDVVCICFYDLIEEMLTTDTFWPTVGSWSRWNGIIACCISCVKRKSLSTKRHRVAFHSSTW